MRHWLLLPLLAGCGSDKADTSTLPAGGTPGAGTPTGAATGSPTGRPTGTSTGTSTGSTTTLCRIDTFDQGLVPSVELHVDEGGSDGTGDGSAANPFATIGRAAQDAAPGTSIVVHAGTYPGGDFLTDLRGTQTEPIWVGGAAGEARPILLGGNESLHLVRPAWVVLHDLEATAAANNGINIDDGGDYANPDAAHHVVVRNVWIHDIGGGGNEDCLKLSGLSDHVVLDSTFERCGGGGSGSGIDHVGCHDGLIARNRFAELSGSGIQSKGGSTNIEIRANWFEDAGLRAVNLGGSTGFAYFRPPLDGAAANAEARGLQVHANVFVGSEAALAFVGCTDCVARQNTVVNPANWLVRILQETTTGGGYAFDEVARGVLENNLFLFTRYDVSTEVNIGPNTDAASFTWTSNLFYATDDPANSAPTLQGTETGTLAGVDPLVADAEYRLGAGSPAIGAGVSGPVLCDRDGRPYADPPTLGAYAAP